MNLPFSSYSIELGKELANFGMKSLLPQRQKPIRSITRHSMFVPLCGIALTMIGMYSTRVLVSAFVGRIWVRAYGDFCCSVQSQPSFAMLPAQFASTNGVAFVLSPESDAAVSNPSHQAAVGALAGCLLMTVQAAHADFRLCNNTASRVSIALAYTDGETWVSEGWWNVKPNGCETLVRGALAAQFYYAYAMDERGGEWKGKAFMCTRDREFKISGRNDCFTRGFDRTGFFEIDTGKDSRNWTVQLTDPLPQASAAPSPGKP